MKTGWVGFLLVATVSCDKASSSNTAAASGPAGPLPDQVTTVSQQIIDAYGAATDKPLVTLVNHGLTSLSQQITCDTDAKKAALRKEIAAAEAQTKTSYLSFGKAAAAGPLITFDVRRMKAMMDFKPGDKLDNGCVLTKVAIMYAVDAVAKSGNGTAYAMTSALAMVDGRVLMLAAPTGEKCGDPNDCGKSQRSWKLDLLCPQLEALYGKAKRCQPDQAIAVLEQHKATADNYQAGQLTTAQATDACQKTAAAMQAATTNCR